MPVLAKLSGAQSSNLAILLVAMANSAKSTSALFSAHDLVPNFLVICESVVTVNYYYRT